MSTKVSIAGAGGGHGDLEADLRAAYPVMVQLRSDYSLEAFVEFVRRLIVEERYQLVLLRETSAPHVRAAGAGPSEPGATELELVRAVAGFSFGRSLAWGRYMYVHDLVTDGAHRSAGFGRELLSWLAEHAREAGCGQLHLDSGVQRFKAHRFYLCRGFRIASHHFSMEL